MQRDLERTLDRLPTDASFRRDSSPEPGPRVLVASAITRNDRLLAATVAVQEAGAPR
jgi:hypothetical protein